MIQCGYFEIAEQMVNPQSKTNDRRTSHRFPLRLPIRFRFTDDLPGCNWTSSESLNISSSGLLFATMELVMPGRGIEAFIAWPVFLDKRIPLNLVIKGSVVRNSAGHSAMYFERHEFRTGAVTVPQKALVPTLH